MDRRDFLKTAGMAAGAALLPFPALAVPVSDKFGDKVFHITTVPSGWTSGPHEDHYSERAVVRIWELTAAKLEKRGHLPVWENYDTSRPAIGWLTHLELNQRREVNPVHGPDGRVLELVPGRGTTYLVGTVRSHSDLTGINLGPVVVMNTRDDGPYVCEGGLGDVKDWSVFGETKFQGLDLAAQRVV